MTDESPTDPPDPPPMPPPPTPFSLPQWLDELEDPFVGKKNDFDKNSF